jgi:hypothetical protein
MGSDVATPKSLADSGEGATTSTMVLPPIVAETDNEHQKLPPWPGIPEIEIQNIATRRLSEPPGDNLVVNHASVIKAIETSMELYHIEPRLRNVFLAHFMEASCKLPSMPPNFKIVWIWGRDQLRDSPQTQLRSSLGTQKSDFWSSKFSYSMG